MFSSQLKVQQSLPRQRMLETHYRVPVVNHSHVWPSILSLNWSINLTPKTELQSDYVADPSAPVRNHPRLTVFSPRLLL